MWLLPVPELPSAITFSRARMYSHRARSRTSILFRLGMAAKSKLSRLFTAGNRALRCRPGLVRRARWAAPCVSEQAVLGSAGDGRGRGCTPLGADCGNHATIV